MLELVIIALIALGLAPLYRHVPKAMLAGIAVLSFVIYLVLGQPDYADQPAKAMQQQQAALAKRQDDMITVLKRYPENLALWQASAVLAQQLADWPRAITAYRASLLLANAQGAQLDHLRLGLATSLIMQEQAVGAQAYALLQAVAAEHPNNPHVRFYLGFYYHEKQQFDAARRYWQPLMTAQGLEQAVWWPLLQHLYPALTP